MNKHRLTVRQSEIMNHLSGDFEYSEVGTQPYAAPAIHYLLNLNQDGNKDISLNSVRTTLKLLVKKGLVELERKPAEVNSGLGYITRDLDHYWNVSTKKEDKKTAKEWNDGAKKRQDDAMNAMFG